MPGLFQIDSGFPLLDLLGFRTIFGEKKTGFTKCVFEPICAYTRLAHRVAFCLSVPQKIIRASLLRFQYEIYTLRYIVCKLSRSYNEEGLTSTSKCVFYTSLNNLCQVQYFTRYFFWKAFFIRLVG